MYCSVFLFFLTNSKGNHSIIILQVTNDHICDFSARPEIVQHLSYPVQQKLYQNCPAQPLQLQIELMCRSIFQCSSRYKFSQDSVFLPCVCMQEALGLPITSLWGRFPCHLTSQTKTTRMSIIVSHFLTLSPIIFIHKTQTPYPTSQQAHNNTRLYLSLSRENSTYPKIKAVQPS